MGGRRAASLIHKQGSMLALVVRTATHFIWFSIDYGICTNVYTHLVLCIHIHTQQWGSLKESSSKCHQQFITWTFRRRRLLFWKSLICIFTFGYQTCTFADLFEGYFCNKNVLYHQTGDHSELIFPQMKGAGFFFKNTYTARDGYTQWSHSEMKREEVKTGVRAFKCGSTFSKYTWYLSNCMSSFWKQTFRPFALLLPDKSPGQ